MRKTIYRWFSWLTAVWLLLSYLSQWIRPLESLNFSLLGLTFPFAFILGMGLLIVAIRRRSAGYYVLLVVSIIVIQSMRHFVNWSSSSADTSAMDLCIMSYNAMNGIKMVDDRYVMTSDIKTEFSEMILEEPQPDIILLQEVNHIVEKILPLSTKYPHYHKLKSRGTAILSKYPIVEEGVIDFGAKPNSCVWADIDIGGDTIRTYSVHLESNRLSEESVNIITKSDHSKNNLVSEFGSMINKYHKNSSVRAEQADQIKFHVEKSPHQVVVAGDFNETPISYTYQKLAKDLSDAYRERGAGLGSTWIGLIPMLRIDYLLADEGLSPLTYERMESRLSDHYPIKASYDLK